MKDIKPNASAHTSKSKENSIDEEKTVTSDAMKTDGDESKSSSVTEACDGGKKAKFENPDDDPA